MNVDVIGACTVFMWSAPTGAANAWRFRSLQASIRDQRVIPTALVTASALGFVGAMVIACVMTPWSLTASLIISSTAFAAASIVLCISWLQTRDSDRAAPDCGCLGGVLSTTVGPAAVALPGCLGLTQLLFAWLARPTLSSAPLEVWVESAAVVVAMTVAYVLPELAVANRTRRLGYLRALQENPPWLSPSR